MTLTNQQISDLNRMNVASQRASLGTLLASLETGDTTGNLRRITETVAFDDFTDGGAAVGTFDLATPIPAGATFLSAAVTALVGFTGNVSAVLTIGDGTDVDRYNTGTPSVYTTSATGIAVGAPSGVQYHTAEKTVRLTVTSSSDFTAVTAGSMTVQLTYLV
jgi:hypothetical protein